MDKKELGILGENIAANRLVEKGYEILERNWRFGKYELDIISRKGDLMVFVEVKTLEKAYICEPWEQVTLSKQRKIIAAANAYLIEKDIALESRFDVVSIVLNRKYTKVEHLEDAFYPIV